MKQFNGPKYQRGFLGALLAVGGAIIGGIASSKAAKTQAKAAKEAGQYQLQAAQETIAEQRRQYDLSRQDYAPWMQAGTSALSAQQEMLFGAPAGGTSMNFVQDDAGSWQLPGYDTTTRGQGRQGFDEQDYLNRHPDVRAAVDRGAFTSGRDHYETVGKQDLSRNWLEGSTDISGQGQTNTKAQQLAKQQRNDPQAQAPTAPAGEQAPYERSPYLPSQEFIGTELPQIDYPGFQGPAAREPLAQMGIPGPADLPQTVGAPQLQGALAPTNLGGGAQLPDVYGAQALPNVLGAPDISTDVGVTAPEFMTPDTSYEAFQASAPYRNMTFQQQEMLRAQAAGRSAQGNLYSGAAGRELERYGANIAQQGYGEFFGQATGAAQDININRQAAYANAMGLSREGYGRETDEFNRLRTLYGDEVARSMTQYGMTQDIYGAQLGQAEYQYETGQERKINQDAINRQAWLEGQQVTEAQYGMGRTAYGDVYGQEMDIYGMGQTAYGQAVTERGTQFDAAGILYGEQYGAAEDVRSRGIQDYGIETARVADTYGLRQGEYEDYYSKLTGLSQTGATATANLGQLGARTAEATGNVRTGAAVDYGNALIGAGTARAAGTIGTANALTQGIAGVTDYFANRPPSGSNSLTYGQNTGEYYGGNDLYFGYAPRRATG